MVEDLTVNIGKGFESGAVDFLLLFYVFKLKPTFLNNLLQNDLYNTLPLRAR